MTRHKHLLAADIRGAVIDADDAWCHLVALLDDSRAHQTGPAGDDVLSLLELEALLGVHRTTLRAILLGRSAMSARTLARMRAAVEAAQ